MPVSIAGDGTITGFDAGASGFGGLVAVKHALFTGTQTNSTAAGASFDITNLSITHAMADASHKLVISAYIGALASADNYAQVGMGVYNGTAFIGVGTTAGNRVSVGAGGLQAGDSGSAYLVGYMAQTFVYEPGDTTSRTYTLRALNLTGGTNTIYVNRNETDTDANVNPRATSGLVIQEVAV